MRPLTHLSLFSGIGGIDLAAEWAGFKTIAFCEKNEFCQKVLKKHWPEIPIIEDVKDVTKERISQETNKRGEYKQNNGSKVWTESDSVHRTNRITLISGGFPCQPHSVAGKHKGSADERNLWPEFRRIIGEIRPKWVLAENVPGLFSSDSGRFFGNILADLASLGYSTGWCTYGANDIGALHKRDRVFIVAYSNSGFSIEQKTALQTRRNTVNSSNIISYITGQGLEGAIPERTIQAERLSANTESKPCNGLHGESSDSQFGEYRGRGSQKWQYWAVEPNVGRVATRISGRVDRLKSLGNAVVPQQIYPVLKAIAEIETEVGG